MGFIKGSKAVEDADRAAQEARKAAFSDRLGYFSLKDGETAFIRLLTPAEGEDSWIHVAQHSGVKTKKGPKDATKWPTSMGAVCRYDSQVKELLGTEDCYICDNKLNGFGNKFAKPNTRVWALAVMRHQIRGDGSDEMGGPELKGKVLGMDDVLEKYQELDADGKPNGIELERPEIVMINMSWSNFFAALGHAQDSYGSVCDRDFSVRRVGEGTDTEYHIMPVDKVPGLEPGTEKWKVYEDLLKEREIVLDDIVLKQASDEHYARFFDPTKTVDKDGKVVAVIPSGAAEVFAPTPDNNTPDDELDEAAQQRLASLRERLAKGKS